MHAIIDASGVVADIVMWDGESDWTPPVGTTAVLIPAGSGAGIGWSYKAGTFTAPASAAAPPSTAPRVATSYDLVSILTDDEVAALGKAKAKDQHLFGKRNDAWPEDNPKIARLSTALGTNPKAWFDRVFATVS